MSQHIRSGKRQLITFIKSQEFIQNCISQECSAIRIESFFYFGHELFAGASPSLRGNKKSVCGFVAPPKKSNY